MLPRPDGGGGGESKTINLVARLPLASVMGQLVEVPLASAMLWRIHQVGG